ncbi:MAG TPA: DUF456 domain-containing protein [Chryseolinea sp.]
MDTFWLVLGIIMMLVGILGSILPLLPGPPLAYLALLIQQLRSDTPFTSEFLWLWAGITVVVTALDYIVPIYGTRKYGGSKYGVWGSTIGLIAGFWLGPLGIIIGPFIGAFVGELIASNDSEHALRAAWGSFVGFLFGTLLKLVVCVVMAWYLFGLIF